MWNFCLTYSAPSVKLPHLVVVMLSLKSEKASQRIKDVGRLLFYYILLTGDVRLYCMRMKGHFLLPTFSFMQEISNHSNVNSLTQGCEDVDYYFISQDESVISLETKQVDTLAVLKKKLKTLKITKKLRLFCSQKSIHCKNEQKKQIHAKTVSHRENGSVTVGKTCWFTCFTTIISSFHIV